METVNTIKPAFVVLNDQNGNSKVCNVNQIATIERHSNNRLLVKDVNDKVIGAFGRTEQSPEDVAKKIGTVIDITA